MHDETKAEETISSRNRASKAVQRICATPSLLLWTVIGGFSFVWILSVVIQLAFGHLSTGGGWRFPYLVVVCSAAFLCSIGVFRSIWLAMIGRSRLVWHAYSFGLGIVAFALMGIVGD